ncbi:hypothetical protein PoB_007255600 [Plakobranchus ocellatus]|uniref:Uncharacterized protein n=1 Tax=Plakobranchus ocellatus TaxID=259542 RepID=A0AAV4DQB6_9GAST|nr:hypothetical protein PoB_007255600 [Plakobranchus ocellatus]
MKQNLLKKNWLTLQKDEDDDDDNDGDGDDDDEEEEEEKVVVKKRLVPDASGRAVDYKLGGQTFGSHSWPKQFFSSLTMSQR